MTAFASLPALRQKLTARLLRFVAATHVLLMGRAFAAAEVLDDNTPIVKLACSVFNALRGPAAFLIALIVIVVGGVAIAIGGRRVIGSVVWGIVGVGIAISAANIVNAIIPPDVSRVCGVGA